LWDVKVQNWGHGLQTKHAFISYVHEDEERADQLQDALEAAGIKVWRDKDDLFPGSDWATEIRTAITSGSLAFIACFSDASDSRDSSYQYEELILAIDQFRKLPPNRQWLFPVRFDDVAMPEYSLGASRTFDSIHRTDLFGPRRDSNLIRLTTTVAKLVGGEQAPQRSKALTGEAEPPGRRVKQFLREPSLEIELDELVMGVAAKIRDGLKGDRFSTNVLTGRSDQEWLDLIADRLKAYQEIVRPLAEIFVVGGAWGELKHSSLWSRAIALVMSARQDSGSTRLLELQDFIPLYLTYAFAMAATARENYYGLNEFLMTPCRRLNEKQPMIERLHTATVFHSSDGWLPTLVTLRAEGQTVSTENLRNYSKRLTPMSDYLFHAMKPLLTSLIPDERDFDENFDQTEILLAIKAKTSREDALAAGRYAHGSWYGRYTWKSRYYGRGRGPVDDLLQRYSEQGPKWKPLQQGLFKSESQLDVALPNFHDEVKEAAQRHY
jgi:hypothetical protein